MERMQTTEQRLGGGRDGTCPAGWVGCDAAVITMMLMKTMSLPLLPAAASFSRAPPLPFAPSCASPLPPLQDESPHPKNSNKFVRVCVCVSVRVCVLCMCVCVPKVRTSEPGPPLLVPRCHTNLLHENGCKHRGADKVLLRLILWSDDVKEADEPRFI